MSVSGPSLSASFIYAGDHDPALGRFTTADTVVPGGVQGYDRYAYVNNDPTDLTDPSGHFGKCREGMSGYLCKVRQKKGQDLELKWALEAAQKKAAAIAAQIARQAQMDAYADATLGQTSFNSPTQILGAGQPLYSVSKQPPPPWPFGPLGCEAIDCGLSIVTEI
jgi:hypothetical protein